MVMMIVMMNLWIRETGTGQQVAKLHDRYMVMMIVFVLCVSVGALLGEYRSVTVKYFCHISDTLLWSWAKFKWEEVKC
jgi:hypothetical protein